MEPELQLRTQSLFAQQNLRLISSSTNIRSKWYFPIRSDIGNTEGKNKYNFQVKILFCVPFLKILIKIRVIFSYQFAEMISENNHLRLWIPTPETSNSKRLFCDATAYKLHNPCCCYLSHWNTSDFANKVKHKYFSINRFKTKKNVSVISGVI